MARPQRRSDGNGGTNNTGHPSAEDDEICGGLGQSSCNGAMHNDPKRADRTLT